MVEDGATFRRKKRLPKPLDRARLEELALAYVARFATSAGKLEAYLKRKLRERGWDGDGEGEGGPEVAALVARCVANGWVDDAAYGRAKAQGLLARGYGPRRVEQALRAADIAAPLRHSLDPDEPARRAAVAAYARRRGFGPYAKGDPGDPESRRRLREKRLAALLRAGHEFDAARRVLDARSIEEVEEWVALESDRDG